MTRLPGGVSCPDTPGDNDGGKGRRVKGFADRKVGIWSASLGRCGGSTSGRVGNYARPHRGSSAGARLRFT